VYVPPVLGTVPTERLQGLLPPAGAPAVLPAVRQRTGGAGNGRRIDSLESLLGWARAHGVQTQEARQYGSGWKVPLAACPFNADHTGGEAALFFRDERPGFKCMHSSCAGYGWKELREHIDPRPAPTPRALRVVREGGAPAPGPVHTDDDPRPAPVDEDGEPLVDPRTNAAGYTVTMQGRKVCNASNVALDLADRGLAEMVWYDLFGRCIRTTLFPHRVGARDVPVIWTDEHTVRLLRQVQRIPDYARCTRATIEDVVSMMAADHKMDPVLAWLESLGWDQTPRLKDMARIAYGAPDDFAAAALQNMLVACVARQFKPGAKYDCMVVLEGTQGTRKSTSLSCLFGQEYVAEWDRHVDSKDFNQQMEGRLCIELAELSSLRRTEADSIKSVLSKQIDTYRPPYGRHTISRPRRTVIVGTTNEDEYLVDPTGNRRMLPVKCGEINLQWLAVNRAQLWAEAVHLYRQGHEFWILPLAEAQAAQERRRISDPWEGRIAAKLDEFRPRLVSPDAILTEWLELPIDRQDLNAKRRVNSALTRLGWRQSPNALRRNGRRERFWVYVGNTSDDPTSVPAEGGSVPTSEDDTGGNQSF
jgi:hypothetical protein